MQVSNLFVPLHSLHKGKHIGELAEWSNAAVLKTVDLNGSGGSNPSLSAKKWLTGNCEPLFVYRVFKSVPNPKNISSRCNILPLLCIYMSEVFNLTCEKIIFVRFRACLRLWAVPIGSQPFIVYNMMIYMPAGRLI